MTEVFSAYVRILLEFLVELYIYCFLVTLKLNRGRRFGLRVAGGVAVIVAAAFGLSFFYVLAGSTVWGRIIIYFALFSLTCLHVIFCYKEDYKTVLLCCSMAYAMQNLTYKLFLFFWTFLVALGVSDGWGDNFEIFYRLIYYSFYALVIVVMFFVYIRRTVNLLSDRKLNYRTLIISILVLGITIIICSFEDVFFARLSSGGGENSFDRTEYLILRQTGNALSAVCCAVVLYLMYITMEERDLKREVEYLQYAISQSEQQYEISKSTIDLINIKCHDIKYKINSILNGAELSPEVIDDLKSGISIYDTKAETGNKLLNVLITEKSLFCEQNGINFSCMADGAKLSFLSDGDLYCLFGNIIDNALEAVKSVSEKERRVINLVVKVKNGLLIVQQDNFFDGELEFEDGLPVTTKADKNYHGFGMRSIRMIVHKYDGELTTYVKDDIFHLNIIFGLNG